MQLNKRKILEYDLVLLRWSGGKDAAAAYLHLLDLGIKPKQIELHHHLVDGYGGENMMDWKITRDYCRKFADHFGSPIYYSWKYGGFEAELNRKDCVSSYFIWQTTERSFLNVLRSDRVGPEIHSHHQGVFTVRVRKNFQKPYTRQQFPTTGIPADRWCTYQLKQLVMDTMLKCDHRFKNKRILVVDGERRQESAHRISMDEFHPDKYPNETSSKASENLIDHWHPVLDHSESKVWDLIAEHGVVVHPCYYLGFGRCGCKWCIFSSSDRLASVAKLEGMPEKLIDYESKYGSMKGIPESLNLAERISRGDTYKPICKSYLVGSSALKWNRADYMMKMINLANMAINSSSYTGPIQIPAKHWPTPAGAYSDLKGPD